MQDNLNLRIATHWRLISALFSAATIALAFAVALLSTISLGSTLVVDWVVFATLAVLLGGLQVLNFRLKNQTFSAELEPSLIGNRTDIFQVAVWAAAAVFAMLQLVAGLLQIQGWHTAGQLSLTALIVGALFVPRFYLEFVFGWIFRFAEQARLKDLSQSKLLTLAQADVVVLQKTGLVTTSERAVANYRLAVGTDLAAPAELLAIAAGLAVNNAHPIDRAILSAAAHRAVDAIPMVDHRVIPGQGLIAVADGQTYVMGGPVVLTSRNIDIHVSDLVAADAANQAGHTVAFIIRDGKLLGFIELVERLHPQAARSVDYLHWGQKFVVILTGDAFGVAKHLAEEIGADDFNAEVLPHQRAESIAKLIESGSKVVVVADPGDQPAALQQAELAILYGVEESDLEETQKLENAMSLADEDLLVFSEATAKISNLVSSWNQYLNLQILSAAVAIIASGLFWGAMAVPAVILALGLTALNLLTLKKLQSVTK
ncbi:MAG: hypothetical protein RIR16_395 [Actinomycetota bacterium]